MRTGTATLPLHWGECPAWLFKRMKQMSGQIAEWIVLEYGQEELLKRISNPYFFQALGCVVGFDWHSSGLTTTLCGALKEAINEKEIGVQVCGGKGAASRKTIQEIAQTKFNVNVEKLQYASRISAKIDNSCIQDGFQLYHHNFFFDEKGHWAVVQQGMNTQGRLARRYHWFSKEVKQFTIEPHSAICCDTKFEKVLNLTARQSAQTQKVILDILKEGPEHIKSISLPLRHQIKEFDISERGMAIIQIAHEAQPKDFEQLISISGLGPKTIRALTLISDLVYGTQTSWEDPVKYAFAHGGKDGIPFPVDKQVYDQNINILKDAIENAKLGNKEKLLAIKKLSEFYNKNENS